MEEELKKLIRENKIIPFVGAGVSKAVKYKSGKDAFVNWKELLENFLNDITVKENLAVIKALLNVKQIDYLEVADKIEKELSKNDFNKRLKQSLTVDYNDIDEDTYELAKSIWGLNSKLIITTNYDKVLHNACEDKNIDFWDIESLHEQGNFSRDGVKDSTVWNLHGHIGNVDNIVLTSQKYKELYADEVLKSKYKASLQLLQNIIASKSLLFIGFSLDDEFIVKQLNKIIEIFGGNNPEHYILIKKDTKVDTLNNNIKVVHYENYGQPLIDKIKSLIPTAKETQIKQETNTQTAEESTTRYLTTLPRKHENFIGRIDELKTIEDMLENDSITYIVNGIGGVGKSDLSSEYFHRNMHRYKNVAFIEFTEDASSIEELFFVKFKEQFNLSEDTTLDSIIKKLQGLPSKNLLLLDNLESKNDFEKIKALNTNFDLLITTRRTDIDVPYQLPLYTLNDKDAKELFLSIYDKDKDIEDILKYLDNHPLFINLTAKSLKSEYISLDELRAEIQNNNIYKIDSKDEKTFKEHLEDRFAKQFSNEPSEELKFLLQVLSIFPSIEIDFKILEKSIATDKLKVKLQKLVDRGWLSKKENSYKLHQIIKLFIQTDYPLEYKNITFVFDNIAKYINPEDSTLIASKLKEYIPIIEYFLSFYKDVEDEYTCGMLDSITYLYYSLGQYNKSLTYQEKSLEIRKNLFGDASKQTAISYNLLGVIYDTMGESNKALEVHQKAIKIREEVLGKKDPYLATSYCNLSTIYVNMNDLKQASEYQDKALKIREEVLDDNDIAFASSYNVISKIYQGKKDFKKALEYQYKSMKLTEATLDEKHPNIATGYNQISLVYRGMNNLSKALEYQLKANESYKNTLGEQHHFLAVGYMNISHIYGDMKECSKARDFSIKSINILNRLDYYSPDLVHWKNYLKSIESNIKKQEKAKHKDKGRYCKDV